MQNKLSPDKIIIYTDGGSRGNPGPAALGVVIKDGTGAVLKSYGQALGYATNNEAEYQAVVSGLQKAKALLGRERIKKIEVEVRMDSQLVERQLNGFYKIEQERLLPFFIKIWNLKTEFGSIVFHHIPRSENSEADRMVNEALDGGEQDVLF
jgi:ribonuclease HI